MQKSALLAALKTELHQHDFSHFVDEPPSIAQGGNGVVVPGCPRCKKRFETVPKFLDHLTDDVLPGLLNRLANATSDHTESLNRTGKLAFTVDDDSFS
jgi:hypothetical protein